MDDALKTRRASRPKFDDLDGVRQEVEDRTQNGETCIQIADALQAKGIKVSSKTVSRRRVDWGLRKRAYKTGYTPAENHGRAPRRKRVRGEEVSLVGKHNSDYRKQEITRLTGEGKTADEIAAILTEQGVVLKSGASTIWRLQTVWKLIPYDFDRANRRGKYAKWRTKLNADGKKTNAKAKGIAKADGSSGAETPGDAALYYPVNCSFGPQRKITAAQHEAPYGQLPQDELAAFADEAIMIDSGSGSDSDGGMDSLPMPDEYYSPSADAPMMPVAQPHAP
ncbi:hypothetical protein LTR36_004552 [Oleoguttula mirabilis]|uniref:Transposase n=1 Tax=Oleoguttula mirabilis TaxID=1507867 RepID=A0AAV9JFN4_9PEZI|nr:hypothetical protein LTR36_004552 [Oleoguttula mirabilis]